MAKPKAAPADTQPKPEEKPEAASDQDLIRMADEQLVQCQNKIEELRQCLSDFAEMPIDPELTDTNDQYRLANDGKYKAITVGMIKKARRLCGNIS